MEYIIAIIIGVIVIMTANKMIDWNLEQKRSKSTQISDTAKDAKFDPGTPLTSELVKQAISYNGFVPSATANGWYGFKIQGETFFVSCDNLPYVQFYKGFGYDQSDPDIQIDLVMRAADKINSNTMNGRITFSDDSEDKSFAFRVLAVEKTYEHLCVSFMDYIEMVNNIIERHRCEYAKLLQERQEQNQSTSLVDNQPHSRAMLS